MGRYFIAVCLLVTFGATCIATTDEYESTARAFAYKQLQDPNTFSPSPPSNLNPYKDMSQEQIKRLKDNARANGSILHFQLNGLPALFMSNMNHKKHGLEKAWHENGRVKYEEHYHEGELVDGIYFDRSGSKLREIKEGTGVQVIFPRPSDMQDQALGFTEYKDGKKHGVETIYRDYEKGLKSRERHYKEGKLHGIATEWMRSGQKSDEKNYKDGVEHGKSIHWYENGNIRSVFEYEKGEIKDRTRYYENGKKSEESQGDEEKRWYPSGRLMLHTVKGKDGKVASGQSFDQFGNENGKVVNGIGSLIEADISDYDNNYRKSLFYSLRVYKPDFSPMPISLPSVTQTSMDYSHESSDINLNLKFRVTRNGKWQEGKVTILLPDGCSSDHDLKFTFNEPLTDQEIELGSLEITLPLTYDEWNGDILADIDGIFYGYKARYQQVILKHEVKEEIKPRPRLDTSRPRKSMAMQTTGSSLKTSKHMPHNAGQIVPADAQTIDAWTVYTADWKTQTWVLYKKPAMLLMKIDREEDWQVVRSEFNYRPQGMLARSDDFILVWGTEPTEDVSKGILCHVEQTQDGGKTWVSFEIPKMDYLLGINENNGVMMLTGVRLPKGGIPEGKEWFEVKPVTMVSKDGKTFIEQVGSSFFDLWQKEIVTKSVAPNRKYKAFISSSHGIDSTSYSLSFVKSQDEIPRQVLYLRQVGDIVWAKNSEIVAIKKEDKFIGYYDVKTDWSEDIFSLLDRKSRDEREEADLEFDQKVRTLLGLQ